MTDPTTREVPGAGTQYLYRLPAEAGGGVAWLSDATHGASVVWHTCPDGVARRAYRCHAEPSAPARTKRVEVTWSEHELAQLDALAGATKRTRSDAIRYAVLDALAREAR